MHRLLIALAPSSLGLLVSALVFVVGLALFEGFRVARSVLRWFMDTAVLRPSRARLLQEPASGTDFVDPHGHGCTGVAASSPRPLLGRGVSLTCSLPGEGSHDEPSPEQPHVYRSSHGRLLSSPPPACGSTDLESVAVLPLLLSAIDPAPNLSAFTAGVELAIFTALATISALLVLAWIIKTMRSSNR